MNDNLNLWQWVLLIISGVIALPITSCINSRWSNVRIGFRLAIVEWIGCSTIIFMLFLAFIGLVAFGWHSLDTVPPAPTFIPTARPLPTARPTPYAPPNTAAPSCYHWNQITAYMQGRTVCVLGLITNLNRSNQAWTRYEFSDRPNTFFLYGAGMEVYDPATGKTLGPGTCVQLTAVIRVQDSVPYINLDDLKSGQRFHDFYYSFNPSDCQ